MNVVKAPLDANGFESYFQIPVGFDSEVRYSATGEKVLKQNSSYVRSQLRNKDDFFDITIKPQSSNKEYCVFRNTLDNTLCDVKVLEQKGLDCTISPIDTCTFSISAIETHLMDHYH